MLQRMTWLRSRTGRADAVYPVDDTTVVADGPAGLADLGDAGGAGCLVVDLSGVPHLGRDEATALAAAVYGAVDRGLCVAVASPGTEVVRALGNPRRVQLAATLDEALACVRGRLTPMPTIRVLDRRQAA
jgi:hypothetical protein